MHDTIAFLPLTLINALKSAVDVGFVVGKRRERGDIGACDHRLDVEMAALDDQHQVAAGGEIDI